MLRRGPAGAVCARAAALRIAGNGGTNEPRAPAATDFVNSLRSIFIGPPVPAKVLLLHLEREDAIGAGGLLIVVDGSALHERHTRLQFREGDNHGVARVEVRRPGGTWRPREFPYRHAVAVAELPA